MFLLAEPAQRARCIVRSRVLPVVLAFVCIPASAQAQGRGPGGPGGGGVMGPPGQGPGGPGNPGGQFPSSTPNNGGSRNSPPPPGQSGATESTMRGGLQLGPPGMWWNDKQFAKSIGLNAEQKHRMDTIFSANKDTLKTAFKSVQHEESVLEKLSHGRVLDEGKIFQQIDRVVQARGELEKAEAHMQIELRKEMTPEQADRLDDHRGPQE